MKRIYIGDIRKYMFLWFIGFFIAIGALFIVVINTAYLNNFKELENQEIRKNVEVVSREIKYHLKKINDTALDWAIWDDTYLYAQVLDDGYEEKNLTDENFEMYGVDIILFMDDSGNLLYGKQKKPETEEITEIDSAVYDALNNSGVLQNKDAEVSFNDILIIEGNPVLIASHPIVRTDGSGPVKGNVLFARTIDANMMDEISSKLSLAVSYELLSKDQFVQIEGLNENGIGIQIKNEEYIVGSFFMPGLFGKDYTEINVEMPRDVIKIGNNSIKTFGRIAPLLFILILMMIWFVLNKFVLSRIVKLNNRVVDIKEEKSVSARIDVDDRSDEISQLSHGINGLLDSLEVEIIERKRAQEEATYLAYHDALTGLPNRLLLMKQLNQEILNAGRQETLISVMYIDLDRFKVINDTLGHNHGDELLIQVASRLLEVVRKNDNVSRIGGDEFILYFNDYKVEEDLEIIASKVMNIFKKPFNLKGQEYYITGSMGISQYPLDGEDVDTLVKNADIAMYKAKDTGKNQYQKCSSDLKHETLETISLTNSLHRAIERNEMMLYYQPQINGSTGEIIGVEALLRWNHPEQGLLLPIEFIPLAEKTRLILPIGYWVLKTACEQCKSWQQKGFKPIRMAVNFSVHQLNYPGITQQIEEVLESNSLEAKYLEIEITESTAMDHNGNIKETLEKIKDLGVTISIDDFGKEHSSLYRLKELPIDRVKIDMSFVQGIGTNDKDDIITKAVILLAANLGLKTTAEGVETKGQKEFLNQRMCDELQGYYLHKPMPADEIEKLLTQNEVGSEAGNK